MSGLADHMWRIYYRRSYKMSGSAPSTLNVTSLCELPVEDNCAYSDLLAATSQRFDTNFYLIPIDRW